MAHQESKKAVIAAIIGNAAIAAIKFAAAAMTGSSAMLSEGIHSLVDTGNGALLFLGIKRSSRPPSATHPFGYGKELYFWSLIVAISIFGIGGGMSIYEGILHIRHPSELTNPTINYIVLGLAMIFESMSFTVAYRAFRTVKGDRGALSAIHHGKDPSLFTVLFEDTAALSGLLVAFAGVFLAHQFDNPFFDGAASVIIGCILAVVAVWLAWESKGLLVGESADPHLVDDVRRFAGDDPVVTGVGAVLTMHLGPEEVLLNLEVEFAPGTQAEEIHAAIHRIEEHITAHHPEVNRIFIEVESLRAVSADGARAVEEDGAAPAVSSEPASPDMDKRHPAPPA
jgi:cation diffusion facilitator family transporter